MARKRGIQCRNSALENGSAAYIGYAGDIVPGDALLLVSHELFVDEAAFTGETYPVEKKDCVLPVDIPFTERSNSLFMGSHIISGKATVLIFASSALGEMPETDFERGIRRFGYLLTEITLLLVIVIFAVNVLMHKPVLDSFLFSLAVGLTPLCFHAHGCLFYTGCARFLPDIPLLGEAGR